jgi:hypothetical protein
MKGFIEYLIVAIEEVEKEFEQDFMKEIEDIDKINIEDNNLNLDSK